uniref:Lipoprotein n=1 Tax=viral metagenome TaxID=1070528 RepID=A0A6M3L851_9ZZZZ
MRKIGVLFLAIIFLFATIGCGNTKVIDGKEYDTYGLLNISDKNPNIEYRTIVGNVIWSIILIETIIFPIYFIGFSLYEPIGIKGNVEKGVVR